MSATTASPKLSRREILAQWNPENEQFWNQYSKKIANQNLIVSTIALTISFCVWTLWSTIAVKLNAIGFHFTDEQLFTLAAMPGLVGATGRLLYTYMPSILGGPQLDLHRYGASLNSSMGARTGFTGSDYIVRNLLRLCTLTRYCGRQLLLVHG